MQALTLAVLGCSWRGAAAALGALLAALLPLSPVDNVCSDPVIWQEN